MFILISHDGQISLHENSPTGNGLVSYDPAVMRASSREELTELLTAALETANSQQEPRFFEALAPPPAKPKRRKKKKSNP